MQTGYVFKGEHFLEEQASYFLFVLGVHTRRCSGALFLNVYSRVYIGSTQEIYVVLWIETVSAARLFNACILSRSLWPLIPLSVHCAAFENKVKYKNKSQVQYPHL